MIKVEEDGSKAVLFTGEADIGQGSDTVLAQMAAEAMGITLDRMDVVSADSDITPLGFGAYSSRVTLMGGNASKMAGDEVRTQVLAVGIQILDTKPSKDLGVGDNMVFAKDDSEKSMPWQQAATKYLLQERPSCRSGPLRSAQGSRWQIQGRRRRHIPRIFLFRRRLRSRSRHGDRQGQGPQLLGCP